MEQKRCENCKRMFGRKILKNGKTEYPSDFKERRFCSFACVGIANAAQRKLEASAQA